MTDWSRFAAGCPASFSDYPLRGAVHGCGVCGLVIEFAI
jgi:hypothetical protein